MDRARTRRTTLPVAYAVAGLVLLSALLAVPAGSARGRALCPPCRRAEGFGGELRPPFWFESCDVTELAAVLRDGGYKADNVVVMTQAAANDDPRYTPMKKRILKELRLLLADRREDDTVLLAFAGHGVHFSEDKNSYFCPADAELRDRATLLSLADVYAELEKCKAGVKVLLVDACRNDPFEDNSRAARMGPWRCDPS